MDLDNANALFTDPSGVSYIKEIVGGTLTIAPSTGTVAPIVVTPQ